MPKEKNKPIYKGIIALFSTILVILLGFTINVNANSYNSPNFPNVPTMNLNYETYPTFSPDHIELLIDNFDQVYFVAPDTNTPIENWGGSDCYPSLGYGASFLQYYCTNTIETNENMALLIQNDINLNYESYGLQKNLENLIHIRYTYDNLYYENEDYDFMPRFYVPSGNVLFNVEYSATISYYDYQKNEFVENDYIYYNNFATNDFKLVPNFSSIVFDTTIGQHNPNTLFKVHNLTTTISINNESDNNFYYFYTDTSDCNYDFYCLSDELSLYYDTIEDRFYSIKSNTNSNLTETLGEQINGFLQIEILPGLTFLGILGIALGIPLLIWILKLFFGG